MNPVSNGCKAVHSGHNDYQLDDHGVVHVCAWCWPEQRDIIRRYPHLEGRAFTHGICPHHSREVLQAHLLNHSRN